MSCLLTEPFHTIEDLFELGGNPPCYCHRQVDFRRTRWIRRFLVLVTTSSPLRDYLTVLTLPRDCIVVHSIGE